MRKLVVGSAVAVGAVAIAASGVVYLGRLRDLPSRRFAPQILKAVRASPERRACWQMAEVCNGAPPGQEDRCTASFERAIAPRDAAARAATFACIDQVLAHRAQTTPPGDTRTCIDVSACMVYGHPR